MWSKESSELGLYITELSEIEHLVHRLYDAAKTSLEELWAFQLELVDHQLNLQSRAAQEKSKKASVRSQISETGRNRLESWKTHIKTLQSELSVIESRIEIFDYALQLSRRLGDTLAWMLLGADMKLIRPLTDHAPVPAVTKNSGLDGVIRIAQYWFDQGIGFPVIHDLTQTFRVGDITIVFGKQFATTVEIKSQLKNLDKDSAELQITAFGISEEMEKLFPIHDREFIESRLVSDGEVDSHIQDIGRLQRQLEKISEARIIQKASFGVPFKFKDRNTVNVEMVPSEDSYNWQALRKLAANAKETGFASIAIDDAFLYVAVYTSDINKACRWTSTLDDILPWDQLKEAQNRLPLCANVEHNILHIGISSQYLFGEYRPYSRPFFLSELPLDVVLDMMWGRLTFITYVNIGKLVEAVNVTDLRASIPNEEERATLIFPVSQVITRPDGYVTELHLGSLREYLTLVTHEFLSLKGFVDILLRLANTLAELAVQSQDSDLISKGKTE